MVIDGRGLATRELFLLLRDRLKMQPVDGLSMELLVDRGCEFRKLKAFLRMSGCEARMEERNGGMVVLITGGCCSCG